MAWTTPSAHVFAVSEVVTAATMNTYIQANLTFLGKGYGANLYQANAQSVATNTNTVVNLDTVENDPNGMGTTGASAKITIPAGAGGVYNISFCVASATNGTGFFQAYIRKNAATTLASGSYYNAAGNSDATSGGSKNVLLAAADYVQLQCFQNSGGAINTAPGLSQVFLSLHLLGPA